MKKQCTQVGGQAVLEGVMMRSPGCLAVAVRRAGGQIVVREDVWRSIWDRLKFLRWPFFRGTVVMIEAMINGMQALNFSAKEAMKDEEGSKESQDTSNDGDDSTGLSLAFGMLLGLVFAIGLFKFLPHMAATYAGELFVGKALTVDDVLYHVVDGVVKVVIFVGYVAVIGLMADIKRVFMYHGAEHKAIYALEAGEELNVANAKAKTRLHPRCGTAFIMVVILVFIVVAAVLMPYLPEWVKPGEGKPWYNHILLVLAKLPLLIPVAGVAYEFNRFAGRHTENFLIRPFLWPGLLMQFLTTREPTDEQIEIALVALRTALWREENGEKATEQAEPVTFENFGEFVQSVTGSPAPGQQAS